MGTLFPANSSKLIYKLLKMLIIFPPYVDVDFMVDSNFSF